jgi:D-allose kinase (fragment)
MNSQKKYILGIDIGGTNFRIGLVSQIYEITEFKIISIKELQKGNFIDNLIKQIEFYINLYKEEIEAIGIGFPSIVSKDKKYVYSTPNIKNLDNINITDSLEKKLNIPIYINKDVNFLILKDIKENKIKDDSIVIGLYIGTGFGNAIYINGQIIEGKHGVAGELGHIPVLGSEEVCSCGNIGCIEMYASGKALKKINDENFSETDINNIFLEHGNTKIIKKYIDTLAIPIATEINILDPDYIIIAGGVTIMKEFPIGELKKSIYEKARKPYPAEDMNIIVSNHDQKSGILGAAYYIRNYKKG